MYVVNIEGPDGAGKSSVVKELIKFFKLLGMSVVCRHFPRKETDLGKFIYSVLRNEKTLDTYSLQLLYSADRLDFSVNEYPLYEKYYDILILDRYNLSGFVYGAADGIPLDYLLNLHHNVERNIIKPDISIVLRVEDVNVLLKRMSNRITDKYETREKLEKVIQYYDLVGSLFPDVYYVNAEQSLNLVFSDVANLLID